MDALTAVILSRESERLIDIFIGGMCIFLGWKLFALRSEKADSEASLSWNTLKVGLKRVGPGVLFAGFGAIIVGFSFANPVHFKVDDFTPIPEEVSSGTDRGSSNGASSLDKPAGHTVIEFNSAEDADKDILKSQVLCLNKTIELIDTDPKSVGTVLARLSALKESQKVLELMRDGKVAAVFGPKSVELWKKEGSDYSINPLNAPASDRELLEKMSSWFTTEE